MCVHLRKVRHNASLWNVTFNIATKVHAQSAVEHVHTHQGLIMLDGSLDTVVITPAVQRLRYQDSHAP